MALTNKNIENYFASNPENVNVNFAEELITRCSSYAKIIPIDRDSTRHSNRTWGIDFLDFPIYASLNQFKRLDKVSSAIVELVYPKEFSSKEEILEVRAMIKDSGFKLIDGSSIPGFMDFKSAGLKRPNFY